MAAVAIYTTTIDKQLEQWCHVCLSYSAYRIVVASETPLNEPCGVYRLTGCINCDIA